MIKKTTTQQYWINLIANASNHTERKAKMFRASRALPMPIYLHVVKKALQTG